MAYRGMQSFTRVRVVGADDDTSVPTGSTACATRLSLASVYHVQEYLDLSGLMEEVASSMIACVNVTENKNIPSVIMNAPDTAMNLSIFDQ